MKIYKRLFHAIIFSLLLLSCQTQPVIQPVKTEPIRETGCSTYYGKQWQDCIRNMFSIWEKRENTPVTVQIIDRTRPVIYQLKVVYTIRVCAADFCREWYEEREESAWYHEAIKGAGFTGFGFMLGRLTAAKIILPFLL